MDIITSKKYNYDNFTRRIIEFINGLNRNDLYDQLTTLQNSLNVVVFDLVGVQEIFRSYNDISKIRHTTECVFGHFKEILSDIQTGTSSSYFRTTNDKFEELSNEYASMINADNIKTDNLTQILFEDIKDVDLNIIENLYNEYSHTTRLYVYYLQHHLYVGDNVDLIKQAIERAKDKSLGGVSTGLRLQRFGLIPLWQHYDHTRVISHITNIVKNGISGGYEDSLNNISESLKHKKIGLYVFYELSEKSISFDISTLVNRNVVDTIEIQDRSGLTKDVIYKYNTIKQYKNLKHKHSVVRLGDTKSNKWVILRTLHTDYYDIMVRGRRVLFDKAFINKLDRGASPRIQSYQKICNDAIHNHIKNTIDVTTGTSKCISVNIISNIQTTILSLIESSIKKQKPKNLKSLTIILRDRKIEDIIVDILMSEIDTKDPAVTVTFLSSANVIVRLFMKYINTEFSKVNFTESMFLEKTENALHHHIMNHIEVMIKKGLVNVFSNNNLYDVVLLKKKLLNTEL